jgi:EAL domain-containing protein (putative c-di-GMP-specific phosphodiesterase class I)
VSRLGGDEFVVVMANLSSPDVVEGLAENILNVLRQDFRVDEAVLRVTSSIGIAVYPNSGDTADALMKNADAAMYEAKQSGRNTYRFFEPAMHASAMRHLTIRNALQLAIENNQLSLHFQPKYEGSLQRLTGVEALLRWDHPELGSMSPSEFIPIAERSGQIIPIGNWVLREVCAQIVRWDAQGMPALKVALNLSPLQMRADLVSIVTAAVNEAGIAPQRLMFEITETAAMKQVEKSARVIADLQALGFDIAIDDFGAGYSSLAYLQQFHCRQLKIDRFFTSRLDQSGDAGRAIVSAIIALAHALDMEVVAEGVETAEQLAVLQSLNCDQVQGFLLARPVAAAGLQDLLNGAQQARA